MTDVETPVITKVTKVLKKHYKTLKHYKTKTCPFSRKKKVF
jgi:hypothetical protein